MTAKAIFAAEPAPIIVMQPVTTADSDIETAAAQSIPIEAVKQRIVSLIQENNTEFIAFLTDLLVEKNISVVKKSKKKEKKQEEKLVVEFVKKERVPYLEMPFWKANPDLKPRNPKDFGGEPLSKDFFDALMTFATNPETRLTDDMIDDLD